MTRLVDFSGRTTTNRRHRMTAFLAALAAFFLFGTYGFWILLGIAFIIATALEENEHSFIALLTIAGALAAGQILKPIALNALHHPLVALGYFAAYFAIGTAWGAIKWTLYVRK